MRGAARSIGRARTVLVFGEGDEAQAVISTVVAHASDGAAPGQRLRFVGPVVLEKSVEVVESEVA